MHREQFISIILRVGLAFAFLYPAIAALFDPVSWGGYIPSYVRDFVPFIPKEIVLHIFGAIEAILALWVLSGWKIKIPALLMAGILIAIVALHTRQFEILFRDLSIAAMALALAFWPYNKKEKLEAE